MEGEKRRVELLDPRHSNETVITAGQVMRNHTVKEGFDHG
jgi:hypothetical protein